MRLREEMIEYLSKVLMDGLVKGGYIELKGKKEEVEGRIRTVIREDLLVEDRLNEEVREILRAYAHEIDRGEIDYMKMFNLVKSKLVKERGLIL
ncbi:MAG: DUF507 family protein [Candidatus Tectomicrobia bacterium]|uniref:DUF507 family protein n=1 Tax=Tectimicrobiota bacterium TaxID=2528274 RepID=A0A932CLL9_UNCTE|nr:DUF507 family protein [Candidatus Tectomicrobia bacterium]